MMVASHHVPVRGPESRFPGKVMEIFRSKVSVYEVELDLRHWDSVDTRAVPRFGPRLFDTIPSLKTLKCNSGKPGGFYQEVSQGTGFANVIEHVILELINLADPGGPDFTGWTREVNGRGTHIIHFGAPDFLVGRLGAVLAVDLDRFFRFVLQTVSAGFTEPQEQDGAAPLDELRAFRELKKTGGDILVVDDDEVVRRACRDVFRYQGYGVLLAGNGAQALSVLPDRGERIALVLLDLMLPDMTGVEIIANIYRLYPEMRILLMSGYTAEDQDIDRICREKRVAFIGKPFTMSALGEKVESLLAGVSRGRSGPDGPFEAAPYHAGAHPSFPRPPAESAF